MGLSEEIIGKLIDKMDVSSDNRIESGWNFEVVFWVRNYVQVGQIMSLCGNKKIKKILKKIKKNAW